MKILSCGASGTGKTTIAKPLSEKFNLHFKESSARKFAKAGLDMNEGASRLGQLMIIADRMFDEHEDYISDRSPICSLAYAQYQLENVWGEKPYDNEYFKVSEGLVRSFFKNNDVTLFYFPIFWPVTQDGFRSSDQSFHESVDNNICNLIEKYGILYHTVPNISAEERIEWVSERINRKV